MKHFLGNRDTVASVASIKLILGNKGERKVFAP